MQIDIYKTLNISGMPPDKALPKVAEHVNSLTTLIVQLNNEIEQLKRKHEELERQNSYLQSRIGG